MKKNLVMRIAAVVLMCTLVTACFASSTFAKYTSGTTEKTSTATVAKWDVKLNNGKFEEFTSFDLFETVLDNNDAYSEYQSSGSDANVAANKIAPGTKGEFTFEISNASEVDATYKIELKVTNPANVPLTFTVGDETKTPDENGKITFTKDKLAMNATDTVKVTWAWDFVANGDANDTALGTMATLPTVTVGATITADQLN